MNKNRFKGIINNEFHKILELTDTKGEEYSRSDDQLDNFKRQSIELGTDPDKILMVYLNKHLDAIKYRVKTGEVKSEPISGRISDAILYLLLLQAMYDEMADHPGT